MKKNILSVFIVVFLLSLTAIACCAEEEPSPLINNGDGTYSMENGIYLRHYDGYSEEAQVYLSALDACYSVVSEYSPIIDPYINGEKSFEDEQWNTIFSEVKYMSGKACSYVMSNETPDDLSEHSFEIFYSAYHLMIANDLLLDAIQSGDDSEAAIASYYYTLADQTLEWWNNSSSTEK